jgi:hypothetical protein
MIITFNRLFSLFALMFLILCVGDTALAQFSLPKQSRAIFSGQLIDANTGEPLSEATVFIRTEYGDNKAKTDAAGNFLLEVDDAEGLKKFLVIFSHPDYREKDMSSLIFENFRGKARLGVQGESGRYKYKKNELSLSCGNELDSEISGSKPIKLNLNCQSGTRTLSFTISRGNTISVSSSSDIDVEIDDKKTKIIYTGNEPARIDIKAIMFKR